MNFRFWFCAIAAAFFQGLVWFTPSSGRMSDQHLALLAAIWSVGAFVLYRERNP